MDCCKEGTSASVLYQENGHYTQIGPLNSYVSSSSSSLVRILVLLPDGFGLARHNLILADMFAAEGYRVVIPDYFEGDAIPDIYLKRNHTKSIEDHDWSEEDEAKLRNFTMPEWAKRHPHSRVGPLLSEFLTALPESLRLETSKPLLAVGYCFGGKYAIKLASSTFAAAAALHPSFVTAEDCAGRKSPTFIGLGEKDDMVPSSLPQDLNSWLDHDQNAFTIKIYEGMKHGFGARPNHGDAEIRRQFYLAFQNTLAFFENIA